MSTFTAPAAPAALAAPATPATAHTEPLPYAYSTGNAFAAFAKFNGKTICMEEKNGDTALCTWPVGSGTGVINAPVTVRNVHTSS